MAREIARETVTRFVEETRSHLEAIRAGFNAFCDDSSQTERLARAVCLAHRVQDGASMIGLPAFSHVACCQLEILQQLQEQGQSNEHALWTVNELTSSLERFLDGVLHDGVDARHALVAGLKAYRRYRWYPEVEDEDEIQRLLLADEQGDDTPQDPVDSSGATAAPTELSQEVIDELRADFEQTVSPELFAVYREEAEDHVKRLYSGLNDLKTAPHDHDTIQGVRRSAHTLKGAAGAVGLSVVTRLSHRMEDLLDKLYDGTATATTDILKLLFTTTDRLHDLSQGEFDREELAAGIIELFEEYNATLDTGNSNAAAIAGNRIAIDDAKVSMSGIGAAGQANVPGQAARPTSQARQAGQVLRVPIDRIDDVVRTVNESIINRTAFEKRMADFVRCVEELQPILDRLRAVAYGMETHHGTDAMREYRGLSRGDHALRGAQSEINESRFAEFDVLEFDRYNEFHLISGSVAEATGDLNTVTSQLHTLIGDFNSLLARQQRMSRDTQDQLMRIRMVPLAMLAARLHRAVRVVATDQNKNVELIIENKDVELDKTVLEEIADPLLHLLRNAVDHGVEQPDQRVVNGKSKSATIRVRAFYQGTHVVVCVSDDGGGLDHERIRNAAVNGGYLSAPEAEAMTPQEIYPYIFIPGISTAGQVSEVSGRGVGMDIVRDKVQGLKGSIAVDSEPEKGTTFTIRLPITLAVTRALLVAAGDQLFAVPMQSVVQIARLERDEVARLGGDPVVQMAGTVCPLIRLSRHLGVRELDEVVDEDPPAVPVLVVRAGDRQVAVRVERIVAGRDIVVKTLGTHLRKVHGLVGATLTGDGTVVPILDTNTFFTTDSPAVTSARRVPINVAAEDSANMVMIVDDSVSSRRVTENLVKSQGWVSIVAKDGVDALDVLQSNDSTPDVFLLDIEMPRMDGYELLSTLRGMPRFKDTPVVMVTSRAGEKHREKAFSLGASDYLVKPYQHEQLIALIRKLSPESTLA